MVFEVDVAQYRLVVAVEPAQRLPNDDARLDIQVDQWDSFNGIRIKLLDDLVRGYRSPVK
jgi:hypothetical protein